MRNGPALCDAHLIGNTLDRASTASNELASNPEEWLSSQSKPAGNDTLGIISSTFSGGYSLYGAYATISELPVIWERGGY
jgi:hypothetical protein